MTEALQNTTNLVPSDDVTALAVRLSRLRQGRPLQVVDIFSGCGGMSLGFHRAGYTILGGIEIDPKAANSHAKNFFQNTDPTTFSRHAIPHDICTFTPIQFMRDVLGAENPEGLVDVIVGGPPCQAFARVGRAKLREIMQHPNAFREDRRASLYLPYLEYVEFFRPLAVVMENVPDIMNFGGRNVAEEIASSLEDLGYCCRYTILNAAHYGVPQLRQRFFLIALLAELGIEPHFPCPTHYIELPPGYINAHLVALGPNKAAITGGAVDLFGQRTSHYVNPPEPNPTLPPAITVQDALADLPSITAHLRGEAQRGARAFDTLAYYRSDVQLSTYAHWMREWPKFGSLEGVCDHVTRYLPRDFSIFRQMQPGDQYPEAHRIALDLWEAENQQRAAELGIKVDRRRKLFRQLKKSMVPPYDATKFPNKWWKMVPNQPSRTLTAHIGKDTYSHIHYDGSQARVISVREAARLQSFPDGFLFTGPMNDAFRQIGNAVPPLQSWVLATHLRRLLQRGLVHHVMANEYSEYTPRARKAARPQLAWKLSQQGWSRQEIAEAFAVTPTTIRKWLRQVHTESSDHDVCVSDSIDHDVSEYPANGFTISVDAINVSSDVFEVD